MRMTRSLTRVMTAPPRVGPGPGWGKRGWRRQELADLPTAPAAAAFTVAVSNCRSLRGFLAIPACGDVELSTGPLEGHAGGSTLFRPGLPSIRDYAHVSPPRGHGLCPRGSEPDTL